MRRSSLALAAAVITLLAVTAVTAVTAATPGENADLTLRTDPVRDWLDYAAPVGQLLAVLAAAGGLLFLAKQVNAANELNRDAREAEIRQRTAKLHDHILNPEFAAMTSRVKAFLDVRDASDAVHKIRAWHRAPHADARCLPRSPRHHSAPMASKNDVAGVLNFYETMGAQVDGLDLKTVAKVFGPNPGYTFAEAWWFICWIRQGRLRQGFEGAAYSGFEDLVRILFHAQPAFQQMCTPNPSVRLLALPSAKTAGDGVWELCARLSHAISGRTGELDDILDLPAAVGEPAGLIVDVVAVPTELSFNLVAWGSLVDRARTLEHRLQAMDRRQLEAIVAQLEA